MQPKLISHLPQSARQCRDMTKCDTVKEVQGCMKIWLINLQNGCFWVLSNYRMMFRKLAASDWRSNEHLQATNKNLDCLNLAWWLWLLMETSKPRLRIRSLLSLAISRETSLRFAMFPIFWRPKFVPSQKAHWMGVLWWCSCSIHDVRMGRWWLVPTDLSSPVFTTDWASLVVNLIPSFWPASAL